MLPATKVQPLSLIFLSSHCWKPEPRNKKQTENHERGEGREEKEERRREERRREGRRREERRGEERVLSHLRSLK